MNLKHKFVTSLFEYIANKDKYTKTPKQLLLATWTIDELVNVYGFTLEDINKLK